MPFSVKPQTLHMIVYTRSMLDGRRTDGQSHSLPNLGKRENASAVCLSLQHSTEGIPSSIARDGFLWYMFCVILTQCIADSKCWYFACVLESACVKCGNHDHKNRRGCLRYIEQWKVLTYINELTQGFNMIVLQTVTRATRRQYELAAYIESMTNGGWLATITMCLWKDQIWRGSSYVGLHGELIYRRMFSIVAELKFDEI